MLIAALPAAAQTVAATGNEAQPAAAAPEDPFGRTTPAGAIAGYIQAIAARDYERAARYLDLSDMSRSRRARQGPDLARQFQAVLDREGEIRPRTELSRAPEGSLSDALEPDLEKVGTIGSGDQAIDLLLRRVENEDGSRYWAVSRQTLDAALRTSGTGPLVSAESWLPESFSAFEIAGAPLSHWLTLAAVALGAFVASWIVLRLLLLVLRGSSRLAEAARFLSTTALPVILFLAVALASWTAPRLGISIVARESFSWVTLIVGWLAAAWLIWRLLDLVAARALAGFHRRGRASATAIIRVASRIAKVVIVIITLIAIFDLFGFDVTTAIAALGIGGIALALGAQKTVENLIASLSIISDRPFRVGDVCRFGDRVATVEDVGMRSSKVRTLDRTLLTIPNSSLVNAEIENLANRDRFWFHPVLHVSAATPVEKVKRLLERIGAIFAGDDRLFEQKARVRLLPPVEDRLPIEIFAYGIAADFDAWLEIQEDLVLKLLAVLEEEEVPLVPVLDLARKQAG